MAGRTKDQVSDMAIAVQAIQELRDQLVTVIETEIDPGFIDELVNDIQALARIRNQLN